MRQILLTDDEEMYLRILLECKLEEKHELIRSRKKLLKIETDKEREEIWQSTIKICEDSIKTLAQILKKI